MTLLIENENWFEIACDGGGFMCSKQAVFEHRLYQHGKWVMPENGRDAQDKPGSTPAGYGWLIVGDRHYCKVCRPDMKAGNGRAAKSLP